MICEFCGRSYKASEAEETFALEVSLILYSNMKKNLCGDCSLEAYKDQVDGIFYETCEECGKEFDFIEDRGRYDSSFPAYHGLSLDDEWEERILCCNCALDKPH